MIGTMTCNSQTAGADQMTDKDMTLSLICEKISTTKLICENYLRILGQGGGNRGILE